MAKRPHSNPVAIVYLAYAHNRTPGSPVVWLAQVGDRFALHWPEPGGLHADGLAGVKYDTLEEALSDLRIATSDQGQP
jgi:hypothetical protein